MSQKTPRQWVIGDTWIGGPHENTWRIAIVTDKGVPVCVIEASPANDTSLRAAQSTAQTIIALPDLLAELKQLHSDVVAMVEALAETDIPCHEFPVHETRARLAAAYAVLAKATGAS